MVGVRSISVMTPIRSMEISRSGSPRMSLFRGQSLRNMRRTTDRGLGLATRGSRQRNSPYRTSETSWLPGTTNSQQMARAKIKERPRPLVRASRKRRLWHWSSFTMRSYGLRITRLNTQSSIGFSGSLGVWQSLSRTPVLWAHRWTSLLKMFPLSRMRTLRRPPLRAPPWWRRWASRNLYSWRQLVKLSSSSRINSRLILRWINLAAVLHYTLLSLINFKVGTNALTAFTTQTSCTTINNQRKTSLKMPEGP